MGMFPNIAHTLNGELAVFLSLRIYSILQVDVKKARAKPGKIFVGGLKPEMTDEEIKSHFQQFGTVVETEMPYDKVMTMPLKAAPK